MISIYFYNKIQLVKDYYNNKINIERNVVVNIRIIPIIIIESRKEASSYTHALFIGIFGE